MWIWIILILILGAGFVTAQLEDKRNRDEESGGKKDIREAFMIFADFLFEKWCRIWPDWYKVDDYFWGSTTADELQLLHPTRKRKELFIKHRKKKLGNALMVMSACIFLGLVVCLCDTFGGVLEEDRIKRGEYGQGEKKIEVVAEYNNREEDMDLVIREKEYTPEDMESIMNSEFESLKKSFSKGSSGRISGDVNMPDCCYDGIIDVSWRLSDYEVIDGEGRFHSDALKEALEKTGEKKYPFVATAILQYRDIKKEQDWSYDLVMPGAGPEEQLSADIQDAVKRSEENSLNEDYMVLPDKVSGVDITWKDKPKGWHPVLLVLGAVCVVAVYMSMDKEVKNAVEKRKDEMTLDYPEFVSKLTLMISAGISLVNAWDRITRNYEASLASGGKKRYVYEEMMITGREMKGGKPDVAAMESFGDRCRIPCYKRFSTMVTQSMKKGLSGLTESLNYEVRQSFEMRKNNAKILGEQATTKLLLPMGIMLGIVMVVVMAPAFMSMSL